MSEVFAMNYQNTLIVLNKFEKNTQIFIIELLKTFNLKEKNTVKNLFSNKQKNLLYKYLNISYNLLNLPFKKKFLFKNIFNYNRCL